MPNGFHGSDSEWERLEAPILQLDQELRAFAAAHAMHLSSNYHNWPERSVTWGADLRRLIQIFLADADLLTWTFWVCVSRDYRGKRFWKQTTLAQSVPMAEIASQLSTLLPRAAEWANSLKAADLELVTKLE